MVMTCGASSERSHPVRRTALVAALLVGVSLSGCGGSGGSGGSAGSTKPADITSKAIALEDLPDGWAEDNSKNDDDSTIDCLKSIDENKRLDDATIGEADVSYMKGTGIPSLEQLLAQEDTPAHAAKGAAEIARVLDGCGSFKVNEDGTKLEGQIGRVKLPPIDGVDRQDNFQMTATAEGVSASAALIVATKGAYVTFLVWIDLGDVDPDAVIDVASTAIAKLG
jgi:hypothetical protein